MSSPLDGLADDREDALRLLSVDTAMPRFGAFPPPPAPTLGTIAGLLPSGAASALAAYRQNGAAVAFPPGLQYATQYAAAAPGAVGYPPPVGAAPCDGAGGERGGDCDDSEYEDASAGDDEEERYEDGEYEDAPEGVPSAPEAIVSAGAYHDDEGHDTESYASDEEEEGEDEGDYDDEAEEADEGFHSPDAVASAFPNADAAGFSPPEMQATPRATTVGTTQPPPQVAVPRAVGITKTEQAWQSRLQELYQYREQHGDALVPQKYANAKGLGEWVHRQRVQYRNLTEGKRSNLTPERIRALNDVGFEFAPQRGRGGRTASSASPAPSAASTGGASSGMVDLTGDDDDNYVPQPRGPAKRRAPAAAGGRGKKVAPTSASTARNQDTWNIRLEQLKEYHAEKGDFAVPRKYDPNPQLGYWVKGQREQITLRVKGQPSALTQERMGALFDLGFPLPRITTNPNPSLNSPVNVAGAGDVWTTRLNELRTYRLEHGNYAVPRKYAKNPQLGYWVKGQREQFGLFVKGKKSSLTQARMRALYKLGFPFAIPKRAGGAKSTEKSAARQRSTGPPAPKPVEAVGQRGCQSNAVASGAGGMSGSGGVADELQGEEESAEVDDSLDREATTPYGAALLPAASDQPATGIYAMAGSNDQSFRDMGLNTDGNGSSSGPTKMRPQATNGKGKKAPKPMSAAAAVNQDKWFLRLEDLKQYYAENGNFAVPQKYPPNQQLGSWVKAQREQIMFWVRGKPSTLTPERMKALFELGYPLPKIATNPNPVLGAPVVVAGAGDAWNARLNELRLYRLENGDYAVPQKYPTNQKLGSWVKAQREQFSFFIKGKKTTLTQARMRAFYKLGYPFSVPKRAVIKNEPGLRIVAKGTGELAVAQPTSKIGDTVNPEPAEGLNGAGLSGFSATVDTSVDATGTGMPSPEIMPGRTAAVLVSPPAQRSGSSIGSSVSAISNKQDVWAQRLEELQQYRNENGHCLVPQKYESNKKLGLWVSQQRTQYRYWVNGDESSLSREKIRALKELGFAWNGRSSASTAEMTPREGKSGAKRAFAGPPDDWGAAEKRGRIGPDSAAFLSPPSRTNQNLTYITPQTSGSIAESTTFSQEDQAKLQQEMMEVQAGLVAAQSELEATTLENENIRKQLLDVKRSLTAVISSLP